MFIPRLEISFNRVERKYFWQGSEAKSARNQFLLNHCRSGIVLAMQALKLPQGSRVGVMAYNCHTVMNAVWQAGHTPVFVDVTDDLKLSLSDLQRKIDGMKVLIVTHLFGLINDIDQIRDRYPNLIIIEDCAHAFSHPIKGDFGVFSVGQGKFPSVGEGGLLEVNNMGYLDAVKSEYAKLPHYTQKEDNKLYFKLWLKALTNTPLVYKYVTLPLKMQRKVQVTPKIEGVKRMSKGVCRLLAMKEQSYNDDVQQRKQRAACLAKQFNINQYLLGENGFMLVALTDAPCQLQQQLYKAGIDSATHFANCISWASQYGYNGDCPNAEALTHKLLMIPTYSINTPR